MSSNVMYSNYIFYFRFVYNYQFYELLLNIKNQEAVKFIFFCRRNGLKWSAKTKRDSLSASQRSLPQLNFYSPLSVTQHHRCTSPFLNIKETKSFHAIFLLLFQEVFKILLDFISFFRF